MPRPPGGCASILDLRSEMEGREGRIRSPNKGSVDIPMFHAKPTARRARPKG